MGVICYVLLAGYPPFYDEDQKRLFKKIKEGRYHFHEDYWGNTSPEAMDLIRKMLCVDQSKRWSAAQLLQHPWITLGDDKLANKDLTSSITVMRKFNARRRLKAAADAVILANRMKNMMASLGLRNNKEDAAVDKESVETIKKKISLLDADALASVRGEGELGTSTDEAEELSANASGRRPSFEAQLFGDLPDEEVNAAAPTHDAATAAAAMSTVASST
jgi:serine/threonine protein kinase